jgi:succinyl-diaminopimelate desuccinylase
VGRGIEDAVTLPYCTDASVFAPALGVPTVILGPWDPQLAHTVDESCAVALIQEAADFYEHIAVRWGGHRS